MNTKSIIPFSSGALVVTSISSPNPVLKSLAEGCTMKNSRFIVTGDTKSPSDFSLSGCEFMDIPEQLRQPFKYVALCPVRSYARKNIAYLTAIAGKAEFIVETDDDNFPRDAFWDDRSPMMGGDLTQSKGWTNAYSWFADDFIYPRGFPLRSARSSEANAKDRNPTGATLCPIQQGLADENPDVDAVYRMLYPLPFNFREDRPLLLGSGQWCPFNSQNTTFFPVAYPLLYLPAHCSFRMTDIWRSFVAQRIAWEYGWHIAFHSATVYQERNEHNLLTDFKDEIPGYLENERIISTLEELELSSEPSQIGVNLKRCYQALIDIEVVETQEMGLIDAWLDDLDSLGAL